MQLCRKCAAYLQCPEEAAPTENPFDIQPPEMPDSLLTGSCTCCGLPIAPLDDFPANQDELPDLERSHATMGAKLGFVVGAIPAIYIAFQGARILPRRLREYSSFASC